MYEIFERLLKEKNLKGADVTRATGIASSTLTDWKKGRYTPKQDKLQKIADFLGVSLEYLTTGKEKEWEPKLTKKDERDIKNALDDFKNQLRTDTGIMYDGEPLDEEDQEAILAAIEVAERTAILAAKKKFTPKKYRK
ncbi:helix-turn-helix domain-containing protein [Zhenpiania hominis]|uniref:Helix-turn-helix transcriptional regulator n=1 Tax=Zhenpiania hominis TaxID=2763644 RepID=A0A923SPU8_9FIRM|nr:helix-turn-helix transcriptional regulator [Zhenpiania hominis]MBC6678760.1 helix-turn-helix transcriptional regulator [Zhenpiania hominis]